MNQLYIYGNNKEEEKIHDMNRSERASARLLRSAGCRRTGKMDGTRTPSLARTGFKLKTCCSAYCIFACISSSPSLRTS